MSIPQILPLMVGTAGHVDHGKTSLVRHLTGRETDTHPEEKQRGMSIDMGVVPCDVGGRIVGMVDVPGHEDFIRNMVAGASSIDLLLLVIAADDAVMPQTIEHLTIARFLGMRSLIVALTKVDLVTPDLLELVQEDIREFLQRSGFPNAPVIPVSNVTGEGIETLRARLTTALDEIRRPPDHRAYRLDIRSIFQMKGLGTVVTGVPRSGTLHAGESVEILPGGRTTVVRSIQNYRFETGESLAHVSSALNLRDVEFTELHRGMTIGIPGVYDAVTRFIAIVKNGSRDAALPKRSTVRVHSGTGAVTGSLRLIAEDQLLPEQEGFATILLESPLVLSAGDPFLLRCPSPSVTIGGGRVLSVSSARIRKVTEGTLARLLRAEELLAAGDLLGAEVLASPQALYRHEDLIRLSRLSSPLGEEAVRTSASAGLLTSLGSAAWVVETKGNDLRNALKRTLIRYHLINPYVWGMKPDYVCELLGCPAGAATKLMEYLVVDSELAIKHGRLALRDFAPKISAREIKLRDDVLREVTRAGVASIARGNLVEALSIDASELKLVVKLLVDEGQIVVLGSNYLLRSIYDRCREALLELFRTRPEVELNQFREQTETSRNIAAAILDSFDAEGLTRRTEKGRVLVPRRNRAE